MLEQLQLAIVGAILLVIPPLTLLLVTKIKLMKTEMEAKLAEAKVDLDAAFSKIRAHESELGIKTTQDPQDRRVQHVSRDPSRVGEARSSLPPQRLGEGEGGR